MITNNIETATKPLAALAAAGLLALSLTACTGDTPGYCDSDSLCQDPSREGYDPATPHCHPGRHYCYEGCSTDADCVDKTRTWYEAGKPHCHPKTRDCVGQKPTLEQGVDAMDAGPETSPDASDGGADATDQGLDLTDSAPDKGAPLGAPCGTDGVICASGFCVDGYCCDKKCGGSCEGCKQKGKEGTCTPHLLNSDPDNECTGVKECGKDACDGAGSCIFAKPAITVCKVYCKSGDVYTLMKDKCDGLAGKCLPGSAGTSCKPYKCAVTSGKAACSTSCTTHADCHPDSLCDRTDAHKNGKGKCVGVASIVTVGSSEEIADALSKITTSKPYLKVPPKASGNYTKALNLIKSVKIFGTGTGSTAATLKPSNNGPAITLGAGVTVTIQGLKVQGATGTTGIGLYCNGSISQKATLTMLESTITGNAAQGVLASNCDVTLRRNTIQSNTGGGADLSKGALVIVNNVVVKNGDDSSVGGSGLGGFQLSTTGAVTFINNTVMDNDAQSGTAAGVICSNSNIKVGNSILYNNKNSQHLACSISYSDIQGGTSGTGNINKNPEVTTGYSLKITSPCIDKGSSTGVSKIDITGGSRNKGKGVDMGAYEVQ